MSLTVDRAGRKDATMPRAWLRKLGPITRKAQDETSRYTIVATLLATPAVAQDRPLAVDMTEVYRVGGVNAPEWAFFGSVSPTGFDGLGNLLELDRRNKRVVVHRPRRPTGACRRSRGRGPGRVSVYGVSRGVARRPVRGARHGPFRDPGLQPGRRTRSVRRDGRRRHISTDGRFQTRDSRRSG